MLWFCFSAYQRPMSTYDEAHDEGLDKHGVEETYEIWGDSCDALDDLRW